jgi:hypothetical protein
MPGCAGHDDGGCCARVETLIPQQARTKQN